MPLPKPPPKMLAELEQLAGTPPQNTAPAADSAEKCDAGSSPERLTNIEIVIIEILLDLDRRFDQVAKALEILEQKINEIKGPDSLVANDARKQFDLVRQRFAEYRDSFRQSDAQGRP